ncbi:MAG: indolepyruvate ferredoxin oxidoreductase subunit alpha [Eubacteriaceae bacterium]
MRINDNCINCRKCMDYCPMESIRLANNRVYIHEDDCVECGVCIRANVCPTNALVQDKLEWPRLIRAEFSDPFTQHSSTGMGGRGTAEMKSNDVTGRFKEGEAGIGLELGRPGMGTRIWEVEKIYKYLLRFGAEFEPNNPVNSLIADHKTGNFKKELLDQKVLSAIIEFKVPTERLSKVLHLLNQISQEITTVFSVSLISKVSKEGRKENYEIAKNLGYNVSLNAKLNVGLGKPRVM